MLGTVRIFLLSGLGMGVMTSATAAEFQKAESHVEVQRAGGAINGCTISFTGVFFDHIYRQGGLSGITGTINVMKAGRASIGLFFKMAVMDWGADMTTTPSFGKIANAYIKSGDAVAPEKVVQCEIKSSFCGVSGYEQAFLFSKKLADNPITVGFNRKPRALDVQLELPTLSSGDFEKFFTCEVDLMNSLKQTK